jgi:hypothetical protein
MGQFAAAVVAKVLAVLQGVALATIKPVCRIQCFDYGLRGVLRYVGEM